MDFENTPNHNKQIASTAIHFPDTLFDGGQSVDELLEKNPTYLNTVKHIRSEIQTSLKKGTNLTDTLVKCHKISIDMGYGGRSGIETRGGLFRNQIARSGTQATITAILEDAEKYGSTKRILRAITPDEGEYIEANSKKFKDYDRFKFDVQAPLSHREVNGGTLHIPMEFGYITDHAIYYANPSSGNIPDLLRTSQYWFNQFSKSDSWDEAIPKLAESYRAAIISHPFETINNSILWQIVNCGLRNYYGIESPSMNLDQVASVVPRETFLRMFKDKIEKHHIKVSN